MNATQAGYVHQACGGVWRPVPGWYSRYRCEGCGAFGYRGKIVTAERDVFGELSSYGKEAITPYLCCHSKQKAGTKTKCGSRATRRHEKRFYCAEHDPREKAKKA